MKVTFITFPKHNPMHLSRNTNVSDSLKLLLGQSSKTFIQGSYDFLDILLHSLQPQNIILSTKPLGFTQCIY